MGTRAQLLAWASSQVGTEGGAGYWQEAYGWSGNGLPWCAVFCTDALRQTGTACAFFPRTYAFDLTNRAEIGDAWVEPDSLQPGDMVAFTWSGNRWSGDHVGIVEKALGNGRYRTIEGNVSDSCGRRTRTVGTIIGGIRPRYKEEEEVTDADIRKIAKAVIAEQIDYRNGKDESKHTSSLGDRVGYIDYITHAIIRKLDEIISLLKG